MATVERARREAFPSAAVPRRLAHWVAVGVLLGLVTVWGFEQEERWTTYTLLAVLGASFLPSLVRVVGSLDRLLLIVFVCGLQIEASYNPMIWAYRKPAGPFGIHISPILVAGAALVAIGLLRGRWRAGLRLHIDHGLLSWSALFLLSGTLSLGNSPDRTLSLFGVFEIATLIVIAVAACFAAQSRDGLLTIERVLGCGLGIQTLLIGVELLTGVQISLTHGVNPSYSWGGAEGGRFAGTLATPSEAATFLVVALLFLLPRMVAARAGKWRQRLGMLFAFGFLGLLLTQTRTAWIALVIGAAGVLGDLRRRRLISKRALLWLTAAVSGAALVAWPLVATRLGANHADDAAVRWNLVLIALEMIKAHPFLGVGLNTATSQIYEYAASAGIRGWVFIVHNQFLLVFAETGIAGFATFVAVVLTGIMAAARCRRAADPLVRDTGLVLFWNLVILAFALNMDHVSGALTYKLLFFLIGMACGLDRLARREAAA